MDYLRGGADVLVCTSIIESGIDIPQANTLIVEHADAFGLAQLYQIRGRVGRSRERAYAYLLYDSAAALTPEAAQRLAALSDYTELGAGFKIAMRDLEIRGAGNLLGDEQSGHVAALGFELYMQMLDEAVARRRAARRDGEALPEPVRLDVNVDAYVPPTTSPTSRPRSRSTGASRARSRSPTRGLREELADRFGPAARAGREPARAAARAHQVRPGRRADGELPRRAPGGGPDRARLAARPAAARGAARGALRIGPLAGVGARSAATARSASPASSGPPMRCWRSCARPLRRAPCGGHCRQAPALVGARNAYQGLRLC